MSEHAAQRSTTEPNYVRQALEFFARMGPAEAIVHGERRYSYAETRTAVLAMATALTGRGGAHAPRDVEFVDGLPMTHQGKVDKQALRVRYHHS